MAGGRLDCQSLDDEVTTLYRLLHGHDGVERWLCLALNGVEDIGRLEISTVAFRNH